MYKSYVALHLHRGISTRGALILYRVHGLHLLDSMDDGTDMIDPDPFLMLDVLSDFVPSMEPSQE